MNRKVNALTFVWIFIACVLLAAFRTRAEAASKDFYFPEVRIEVTVEPDGSFVVDEFRTYDFRGSFSWALMWIPLRVSRKGYSYDVRIEDFKILDEVGRPLRMERSMSGGKFQAKWYYSAKNVRRTFHIHYRLKGGIISYPEVSELYWQIIGSEWDKPAKKVVINVHLPEGITSKNDILVYGHGPFSGNSEIVDEKRARFTVNNLRSRQYVEIRVVWPAGLVSGVYSSRHTLKSIRQEEAGFVQETIERARRAREAAARARAEEERKRKIFLRLLYIWGISLIIGPLIWLPFYLHFWKKVGEDYRFDDIPEYFRTLPSKLSPALVEVLLREGRTITPSSFTATLFDLARRGYIEMEDRLVEKRGLFGRKEEYQTTITCRKAFLSDSELFPYETELLSLLFITVGSQGGEVGSKIELDDLKTYLEKKPRTFQKWYREWTKMIQTEAKKLKFIEPESTKMRKIFLAVTMPLAFLTLNPVLGILGRYPGAKDKAEGPALGP